MNKSMLALAICGIFAYGAAAADNWFWVDTGDHNLNNPANWHLNSAGGAVAETMPALDTATTGSTHPRFVVRGNATLSLPNDNEMSLNAIQVDENDSQVTIDLGSRDKQLKFFGCCDAVLWPGNWPKGQNIVLKRGTLTNYASSQRHWTLRLGAAYQNGWRPSSLVIDGPDAHVEKLVANIEAPGAVFCVTNGAVVNIGGANYSLRMNNLVIDGGYRISGHGSVINHLTRGNQGFFFGDGAQSVDEPSGFLEINDGGMVTNMNSTIGNRGGNFSMRMDNGIYEGTYIQLAANQDGVSTNNSLTAKNGSEIKLSNELYVGTYGGYNRMLIEDSYLKANIVRLGYQGKGYGYNSAKIVGSTFSLNSLSAGENAEGPNACNNYIEIRNSKPEKSFNLYISSVAGGANVAVLADGVYTNGSVVVGRKGSGMNELIVTNATLAGASFEIGGNKDNAGCASSGNRVRFIDTKLGSEDDRTCTFMLANAREGCASTSNTVEFVRSSWYNKVTYFGIGGWNGYAKECDYNAMIVDDNSVVDCLYGSDGVKLGAFGFHNRLEVKNGSEFHAAGLMLGSTFATWRYNGTNTLYVGKDSLVVSTAYFQLSPGGNRVVIDDGVLKAKYLRLHYYYSDSAGITKDNLANAESEYGKTGKELWGSTFIFKGSHPVMRFPYNDATSGSDISGTSFDRTCIVRFELPETPYAQPPLQSAYLVSIGDGTTVEFDMAKVGIDGGNYVLADCSGEGNLTVGDTQVAAMDAAAKAAALAVGRRTRVYKDGKKLICHVNPNRGFIMYVR